MKSPIFVHSIFRTGSTYLFGVFRRSTYPYYCFQEPLHEKVFFNKENPDSLHVQGLGESTKSLRHPNLEKDYFQEIVDLWPSWKNSIDENIVYDEYFLNLATNKNTKFWEDLIAHAPSRPVFQECRTSGRIKLLKDKLGGLHIYAWRNPWDQWWSYKINDYFSAANQLILHSSYSPLPIKILKARLGLVSCKTKNIQQAFDHYTSTPLNSAQSYQVFYMIWCLGLRNGLDHCQIKINMDRLSDDPAYRDDMLSALNVAGVTDVDFSDCKMPQSIFLNKEKEFFHDNEQKVHQDLLQAGWSQSDIDNILNQREIFEPYVWAKPDEAENASLILQASLAREIAIRFETEREAKSSSNHINFQDVQAVVQQLKAKVEIEQSAARIQALELNAVYNSTSWRITAPLRWLVHQLRLLRHHGLTSRIKALTKRVLKQLVPFVVARPTLRTLATRLAYRLGVAERLKPFVRSCLASSTPASQTADFDLSPIAQYTDLETLSPRARQIYADLKAAIEQKKG